MSANSPHVLVTGSSGFLGGHIARQLVEAGVRVTGVDRDASIPSSPPGVEFHQLDLGNPEALRRLAIAVPDVLVHAAGPADVQASLADPVADFEGSVSLLQTLMEHLCTAWPQCRVIFLSSAAVYGQPSKLPISESHALAPVSPYGFHKVLCERLLESFREDRGVSCCSLRIFSAYGAGLRKQVLWDIARKALTQAQVDLFGTGEETRDFIAARDVALAVHHLLCMRESPNTVHNLASGTETTIRGLAEVLLSELGCEKPIVFSGLARSGDPQRWRADTSSLARLGFQATTPLRRGVRQMTKWARAAILGGGD